MIPRCYFELKEQLPFLPRHLQNEIEIITVVSVRQLTELKLPSRILTVGLVQHFKISTETEQQLISTTDNF